MTVPQILHVAHRFPYPPDKGDRIRVFHWLKHLARNAKVSLIAFADEPVSQDQFAELQRLVHRIKIIPKKPLSRWWGASRSVMLRRSLSEGVFFSRRVRQTIQSWVQESPFDSAIFSASSLGRYAELPELRSSRKLVDFMDVDSLKWQQYAAVSPRLKGIVYRRECQHVERLERQVLGNVDAVTFVSQEEANLFRINCAQRQVPRACLNRIHSLGNGVDLEYFSPDNDAQDGSLCFLGAMDYRPNIDAVVWFVRDVWPHLRKKYCDLTFHIVGRNPSRQVRDLQAQQGVHVTGRVDDVRPYLSRASVVVAPLRIARGVQNKVLEAMAMGRTVVASPEALTGLRAAPEKNVLQATTPDDWFYQIRRLIEYPDMRRELAQAGRAYVEQQHSWQATLQPLNQLVGIENAPTGSPALH